MQCTSVTVFSSVAVGQVFDKAGHSYVKIEETPTTVLCGEEHPACWNAMTGQGIPVHFCPLEMVSIFTEEYT